jgi:hypothetical protein
VDGRIKPGHDDQIGFDTNLFPVIVRSLGDEAIQSAFVSSLIWIASLRSQ